MNANKLECALFRCECVQMRIHSNCFSSVLEKLAIRHIEEEEAIAKLQNVIILIFTTALRYALFRYECLVVRS